MPSALYASLIKAFVALSAPDQPALTEDPGALQFTVGEHTCTVFALEDGRQLVIQSDVMGLVDLGPDRACPALRMLHGLNWASSSRTGIVALVDESDRVLVSKTLEIRLLDAPQMAERMAALLDSASSLRELLKALPVPGTAMVRPAVPPHRGSFA